MIGVPRAQQAVPGPAALPMPAAVSATAESPVMASATDEPLVVVSDPWLVHFADLTVCDVGGCSEPIVPEAWALIDLDTGDGMPGRFCEDHQLAWLRRPRPVSPTVG